MRPIAKIALRFFWVLVLCWLLLALVFIGAFMLGYGDKPKSLGDQKGASSQALKQRPTPGAEVPR